MTQSNTRNRKFVLAERPKGEPDDNTLRLETDDLPIPAKGQMGAWVNEGKIRYREEMIEGFEQAPTAFAELLRGEAFGKRVVHLKY